MEYGNHKKHSAGARNVKARAKRALLLPSYKYNYKMYVAAFQLIVLNLQSFRIFDKTKCFLYNHFVHTHI